MNRLDETHFKRVEKCPWCGGNEKRILYKNQYDACIQECNHCKLVYSDKILNEQGLEIYWNSYLSQVQNKDTLLTQKRMEMYDIEFQFISRLIDLKDKEIVKQRFINKTLEEVNQKNFKMLLNTSTRYNDLIQESLNKADKRFENANKTMFMTKYIYQN